MLRSLVVGRLGRAGDEAVIKEARERFAKHCDGSQVLPADLRSAVSVCWVKKMNGKDFYFIVYNQYIFV